MFLFEERALGYEAETPAKVGGDVTDSLHKLVSDSRKPGVVRAMIEKVSPGAYLELFDRERLCESRWTVFGNRLERRLF